MSISRYIVNALVEVIALAVENMPLKTEEKIREAVVKYAGPIEKPESHISTPKGVSVEKYCLECTSKHIGTAKILLREALQRAEKGEPKESIVEKVRGAYEEVMGAEDDSQALSDEGIRRINTMVRDVRKWFFTSGVIADVDKERIAEALRRIDELNKHVYGEIEKRITGKCEICVSEGIDKYKFLEMLYGKVPSAKGIIEDAISGKISVDEAVNRVRDEWVRMGYGEKELDELMRNAGYGKA
jgi:hypothetical protein